MVPCFTFYNSETQLMKLDDFEKKFIKAEVVSFEDFSSNNGWLGAQGAGKVRMEGKDYEFKDGDVAIFRHG